jgi:glutathione-independent formaldehyde dehydrogenase
MKGLVYNGPRDVSVKDVPDPRIERATDAIIQIARPDQPDRLALAGQIGAIPIDDSKADPVDEVMEETGGLGADRGCECVGYQAHDPEGHEHPNVTLNNLVESVKFTGSIGTVGVYVPQDPGGPHELPLDQAPEGYQHFDARDQGWTKVVLTPSA